MGGRIVALHDTLLTEEEAAERIGFSYEWLRQKRRAGKGPTHIPIGNRILYDPNDIDRWLESLKTRKESNHE